MQKTILLWHSYSSIAWEPVLPSVQPFQELYLWCKVALLSYRPLLSKKLCFVSFMHSSALKKKENLDWRKKKKAFYSLIKFTQIPLQNVVTDIVWVSALHLSCRISSAPFVSAHVDLSQMEPFWSLPHFHKPVPVCSRVRIFKALLAPFSFSGSKWASERVCVCELLSEETVDVKHLPSTLILCLGNLYQSCQGRGSHGVKAHCLIPHSLIHPSVGCLM